MSISVAECIFKGKSGYQGGVVGDAGSIPQPSFRRCSGEPKNSCREVTKAVTNRNGRRSTPELEEMWLLIPVICLGGRVSYISQHRARPPSTRSPYVSLARQIHHAAPRYFSHACRAKQCGGGSTVAPPIPSPRPVAHVAYRQHHRHLHQHTHHRRQCGARPRAKQRDRHGHRQLEKVARPDQRPR